MLEGKGVGEAANRISHVRLHGFSALSLAVRSLLLASNAALPMGQAYVPTLLRNWCVAAKRDAPPSRSLTLSLSEP